MARKKRRDNGSFSFQKPEHYGTLVPRIPTSASEYFKMCVNEGEPIGSSFFVVLETVDVDLDWAPGNPVVRGSGFGDRYKSWSRILIDGRVGWVMSLFVEGK